MTSCTPSLRHTRRLHKEATTSSSLSLSHSLYTTNFTTCNNNNNIKSVCPKSYIYMYDFRVIYTNVHTNRSDRSEPVLGSAGSLSIFHPEGHVSQQNLRKKGELPNRTRSENDGTYVQLLQQNRPSRRGVPKKKK